MDPTATTATDPRAARIAASYNLELDVAAACVSVAERLGADPFDLANLIWFESGWDPKARNRETDASGLIQWIPTTAARFGLTTAQIRGLSRLDQLPHVERYLASIANGRALTPIYRLAMAVFYPAAMSWSSDKPFPPSVTAKNPQIKTPGDYTRLLLKRARLPSTTAQAVAGAAAVYGRCWSASNPAQDAFGGLLTPDAPCFPAKDLDADQAAAQPYRDNLVATAVVLQQVRDLVGPLSVGSGFRTPAKNSKINGSATSMHLKGLAVDVTPTTMSNRELAALLYSMRATLPFDQVIWYTNTRHVHLGLRDDTGRQRGQFLSATKDAGALSGLGAAGKRKTTYATWAPTAAEQDAAAQKMLALPNRVAKDLAEPQILPAL